MRVIGVIDLLGGRAVHAKGGCRHGYRPIETAANTPIGATEMTMPINRISACNLWHAWKADRRLIANRASDERALQVGVKGTGTRGGIRWAVRESGRGIVGAVR